MLLPQGTILPNFYFFSIFLQKLCCLKRLFIMQRGVGAAPPTPLCYFLLSSTPTIDTEPKKKSSQAIRSLLRRGDPYGTPRLWASRVAALTCPRHVIHSRSLRVPRGVCKKNQPTFGGLIFLVTRTGLEPMLPP